MTDSPLSSVAQESGLPQQGRPGMGRRDLEFMPAVVETLESPPSPYATVLLGCLCSLCAIALLLMVIGRVDVVAAGQGVVIPPGNVIYVQAEIQGRIARLTHADGEQVRAGETIIELDRRTVDAQMQGVEISLQATRARHARQVALLAWLEHWNDIDPGTLTLAAERAGANGEQQELLRQKARLIKEQLRNESAVPQRRLVLIADERRQAVEDLDQASEKIGNLEQELIKAKAQRAATFIDAPVDGVLVGTGPLAAGMVVSPATGLLQIVPLGSSLQIEAKIPAHDLGHVRLGDACVVKLDAFPYTTWGKIESKVSYLGANAVEEKDGKAYFVIRCQLNQLPESLAHAGIKLSSGMSGSVEITTGRRSVLAYLFSPLVESLGRAFHER